MEVKSESEVAQSVLLSAIPWTAAYQAPQSMGFSRQEYWSGLARGNAKSQTQLSDQTTTYVLPFSLPT